MIDPSIILSLSDLQEFVSCKSKVDDLIKANTLLSQQYIALHGLYHKLLCKVNDLEKLI